jgi:hypothetical protein
MKRLAGWAPHPESVFCSDRLPRSDRNDAAREQDMDTFDRLWRLALAAICALSALAPSVSQADGTGDWKFTATVYGWLPSIDGTFSVPADSDGTSITVDAGEVLDALNFMFMGALEADKGRWSLVTDLIYFDLGGSQKKFRDFTLGAIGLPATVTADARLDTTGWIWSTAGGYLVIDDPHHSMKLLAGARMLDLSADLKWHLEGDISGLPLPGPDGKGSASDTVWDAIVALKGKLALGEDGRWYVPYYLDVGTGDSDVTWQGMLGVGYAFDWGDIVGVWRYLDYDLSSGATVESLDMSGAAIGFKFHF